ncbi:MAG: hypothetical protein AAFX39_07630 [Pseudomonadota bacterium]
MGRYQATMMHATTGGEGIYPFDGPDDLLTKTPVRVVRHFMELVDTKLFPEDHVEYELNAAMKNAERGVITAMGSMHLHDGPPLPFLVMIAKAA